MWKSLLAAWVACALAAASAQTASPGPQIAATITPNGLKADVSFLASDALAGRGTPSPGLEAASEFIASQFRRAGLDPAGDDEYFQTAHYLNVTPKLDGLELTLEMGGTAIKADKKAMGFQDPAPADLSRVPAWKAPLEEAALNALAPADIKGKVLFLEAPPNGRAAFAAIRRLPALAASWGPAAIVLVRQSAQGISSNARLKETAAAVPAVAVWDKGVRDAIAAAKPGPLDATVTLHAAAPSSVPVKLRNVVGVLRGADPALRDTYVLLTAHYDHLGVRGTGEGDHIFNGANDDASGTASLIEIAGALAGLPERPKRSIVFVALFGEELGLLGSRYYGQHPIFPLAKTIADVNLEQVGRTDDVTGPRPGILNMTGFDYSDLPRFFQKAGEEFGVQVLKDDASSDPFFSRSDNQAFADAGIPAHTLSVGYVFPDYHQPGDEWPKLDYDNMAKVARTAALAMYRIADSIAVPAWNSENPKTERYTKAHDAMVR